MSVLVNYFSANINTENGIVESVKLMVWLRYVLIILTLPSWSLLTMRSIDWVNKEEDYEADSWLRNRIDYDVSHRSDDSIDVCSWFVCWCKLTLSISTASSIIQVWCKQTIKFTSLDVHLSSKNDQSWPVLVFSLSFKRSPRRCFLLEEKYNLSNYDYDEIEKREIR